jgi:hypothetical protein
MKPQTRAGRHKTFLDTRWTTARPQDGQTDRQPDRRTDDPTDRPTDGQTGRQTTRQTENKQMDGWTDRQSDRRTGGQMADGGYYNSTSTTSNSNRQTPRTCLGNFRKKRNNSATPSEPPVGGKAVREENLNKSGTPSELSQNVNGTLIKVP